MFFGRPVKSVSPREVKIGLEENAICLIDVREPHEFRAALVEGAISMPLSSFKPQNIKDAENREIVLMCQSGMRSAQAVKLCQQANISAANMAGGIMAWHQNGFEVKTEA